MKTLIFALCFALYVAVTSGAVSAQQTGWQPSPGHPQTQIWPGEAPDAQPVAGPEVVETSSFGAGVSNVSRPTMTVYSPSGNNTGVAVVVFPGGGYWVWRSILKERRSATG